jgi:arabinofuranosyltransferase
LLLIFVLVVLKNAWLTDDAYITFRTVENALSGHGLVYNVGERVQSYTHPLWMFMLLGFRTLFGDLYYTTIFASVLLSAAAVAIVLRLAPARKSMLLAFAVLLASKAFCDFATSGLENPLSYLLIASFAAWTLAEGEGRENLLTGTLLFSAIALNRLDNVLIAGSALVYAYRRVRAKDALVAVALGLLPLILWSAFSLLYYGSPIPNTAYAKLGAGIPVQELVPRGLHYLKDSLTRDPVTLTAILSGFIIAVLSRSRCSLSLALGVALYIIYTILAGGDFMSGRFLASPLLIAAALIACHCANWGKVKLSIAAAVIVLLSFQSAMIHLLSGPQFRAATYDHALRLGPLHYQLIDEQGICDERAYYYQATGLLQREDERLASNGWARAGEVAKSKGHQVLDGAAIGAIGFFGYYAGPEVHIVDVNALCDFLLARLPISQDSLWRIGHFTRTIPAGYIESLSSGENKIEDPDLAQFYDAVDLIIRQPIFAPGRFGAILKMNTGGYDSLISSCVSRDR